MEPSLLTTFANFGYPALVSGVLLYIIVNKLEKVTTRMEAVEKAILLMNANLTEHRLDVKEEAAERGK